MSHIEDIMSLIVNLIVSPISWLFFAGAPLVNLLGQRSALIRPIVKSPGVTCKILSINLRISGGWLVGEDWRPKQDVPSQLFSLYDIYWPTRWREFDQQRDEWKYIQHYFILSLQHVIKYRNQLREIDILVNYSINVLLIYSPLPLSIITIEYINFTFNWID